MATLLNADWLSSREIEIHFNSSEFVAPQILVNALACARRKCGATNQNLLPVFSREEFARYASTFTLYGILSPRRVWCERTTSMPVAAQRNRLRANLYSMFATGAFYTSPGEHLAIHRIYSIYRPALGYCSKSFLYLLYFITLCIAHRSAFGSW